jgi:hypothetical protein
LYFLVLWRMSLKFWRGLYWICTSLLIIQSFHYINSANSWTWRDFHLLVSLQVLSSVFYSFPYRGFHLLGRFILRYFLFETIIMGWFPWFPS